MSEETTQSQANNLLNEPAEPKAKSKFWLGFLCGLPIYPLVIPWLLLLMPARFSDVYLQTYAIYIRMIMRIVGEGG